MLPVIQQIANEYKASLKALYGDELHVITFSEAVKRGLLVDYKVIVLAVAEKISALLTADYLKQRAQKGSRKKFLRALGKVPQK